MKNLKLRNVIGGALLLLAAGPFRPAFAGFLGTYLETSKQVAVSTDPANPTQLISGSQLASGDVGLLLFWSGSGVKPNSEVLLLSSANTGFSTSATTGTARISAGNFESDRLWMRDYSGPLYGVVVGTTSAQNVSVIRKK